MVRMAMVTEPLLGECPQGAVRRGDRERTGSRAHDCSERLRECGVCQGCRNKVPCT